MTVVGAPGVSLSSVEGFAWGNGISGAGSLRLRGPQPDKAPYKLYVMGNFPFFFKTPKGKVTLKNEVPELPLI